MTTPAARTTAPRLAAALASVALLVGCATETGAGEVPEGWKKLSGSTVSVACPRGFTELRAGERPRGADAAAVLKEGTTTIGLVVIDSGFTEADTPEEAAVAIEGGLLANQQEIGGREETKPEGTKGATEISVTYDSPGVNDAPKAGTPMQGTVIAGVASSGTAFVVRVDAVEGRLSKADRQRIIDSVSDVAAD